MFPALFRANSWRLIGPRLTRKGFASQPQGFLVWVAQLWSIPSQREAYARLLLIAVCQLKPCRAEFERHLSARVSCSSPDGLLVRKCLVPGQYALKGFYSQLASAFFGGTRDWVDSRRSSLANQLIGLRSFVAPARFGHHFFSFEIAMERRRHGARLPVLGTEAIAVACH